MSESRSGAQETVGLHLRLAPGTARVPHPRISVPSETEPRIRQRLREQPWPETGALTRGEHRQHRSRRCVQEDEERGGGGGGSEEREGGAGVREPRQPARNRTRLAMQMGSIHRTNHWSLSVLQRKSPFRRNSRIEAMSPSPDSFQNLFPPCLLSLIPSCAHIHEQSKEKRKQKEISLWFDFFFFFKSFFLFCPFINCEGFLLWSGPNKPFPKQTLPSPGKLFFPPAS